MSFPRPTVLLPGVGSYVPGALSAVRRLPVVRDTLAAVDAEVRAPWGHAHLTVSGLLTSTLAPHAEDLAGPHDPLLHLAVYAQSLAVFRLLESADLPRPRVLMGHSLGEIAALAAAGVVSAGDGARLLLACEDARRAHSAPPGGLLALRLSASDAVELLARLRLPGTQVACDNTDRQCLISGPPESLAVLARMARARSLTCVTVTTRTLFHSTRLTGVARQVRAVADAVEFRQPRHRLHSPVLRRSPRDPGELRDMVVHHLVAPVRFRQAVADLHLRGERVFVESGCRALLSPMVQWIAPDTTALAPLGAGQDLGALHTVLAAHRLRGAVGPVDAVGADAGAARAQP
ncbi:ACP S-malonyltransferase [Streptomyces sp. NPDC088097]|uniref:ACP S-malonyltransferase n=1 Tax=Streptomyces sp. NPDC088097 TaxID=3365823 RepID=UPI003812D9EE